MVRTGRECKSLAQREEKMDRKDWMKAGREITLILAAFLLLSYQASGANPTGSDPNNSPANQRNEPPKPIQRPFGRISAGPSTFTPNTPFGEAIDILRHSTDPPLPIVVLWRDLSENADIDRTTPIGMDGVSGIPLRQHLELLLRSVSAGSAGKLGYVVNKGVITIATQESLPGKRQTRVYHIADLVSPPANYFFFPGPMGPIGMYGGPFGGMGYGGYGRPSGYGGMGLYGGPYGAGGYGGLYGPRGNYGFYGGGQIGNLVSTLYGPANGRSGRSRRGARPRR